MLFMQVVSKSASFSTFYLAGNDRAVCFFLFAKAILIPARLIHPIVAKKPPGVVMVRTFKCGTTTLRVNHLSFYLVKSH